MEVNPLSLEALSRNGHNLQLGEFECAGSYQIPVIHPVPAAEKIRWIPFNSARTDALRGAHGVHFFIDDYLFERCWNDPARYAKLLSEFRAVLSPDFSMFTDYPPAVQIYNHWRKHILAAYWQRMGLTVIPSICWSDEKSFAWCFDGEPIGGTVAISSVGTQKAPEAKRLFLLGYNEMLRLLCPSKILFFGDVPEGCTGNIEWHTSFHSGLAHAQKKR